MKSLCLKSNNSNTLNYLLDCFENFNLDNIYFSCNKFKNYENIIIHYLGNDDELFLTKLSNIFSFMIIDIYEQNILKKIISYNYFYFDSIEIKKIFEIALEQLNESPNYLEESRELIIFNSSYQYLKENKHIYIDGFINFRLKNYISFLNRIVDSSVNNFIVEREYLEFISLLKIYINSQTPSKDIVHLVYSTSNSILLDSNNNIIDINKNISNTKYLSDISFSNNDYILNTLLSILPSKIIIHLKNSSIDEFINTLTLIFENKVEIKNNVTISK